MERKLYLSDIDKKLGGVCGGVGEYLNVDSTVIRILWIIFGLMACSGILAYIIAWAIMPHRPGNI